MNKMKGVLNRYRRKLHDLPNVHAVGIGFKERNGEQTDIPAIVVLVEKKVSKSLLAEQDTVPPKIEDIHTDVIEQKPYKLYENTERIRPAPGGVSIGHYRITAGTLSCIVKHNDTKMILSNNHVLANINSGLIGDPILQPGAYDGGTIEDDVIGHLYNYVPLVFTSNPCPFSKAITDVLNFVARLFGRQSRFKVQAEEDENVVDCAIAKPVNPLDVSDEILEIGKPQGLVEPRLAMSIQKTGRTTGYTRGVIMLVNSSIKVGMRDDRYAYFTDQLICKINSGPGDSGSAVLDMDNNLVGLLFAGNEETTVCNKMVNVFDALDLSL